MTRLQTGLFLGAGLPILLAIVALAARRGAFGADAFPTPFRRRAALGLLVLQLAVTVLLPAIAGSRTPDLSKARFSQALVSQGSLAAFLVLWWLLSGRPSPTDFLRLRSRRPAAEAAEGVGLGLAGWVLTLFVGAAAGILGRAAGLPVPDTVPPLVRWVASLSALEKLALVALAMTFEEFFFRAFLQARFGPLAASIVFILAHSGYGEPFFFVGLIAITTVLAEAFRRTGSTIAPIVAHGTFNAIQLFVVLPLVLKALDAR
jgi:membrane protease YdiL (CAAX protease family)